MFYNTIYFRSEDLTKAWEDTKRQENLILFIFKQNPYKKFSPSDIWNFFITNTNHNWPLTSIRRSITDLTSDGVLTKLDETKKGLYGKPEFYWQLKQLSKPVNGTLF